jgi:hypothetical protein
MRALRLTAGIVLSPGADCRVTSDDMPTPFLKEKRWKQIIEECAADWKEEKLVGGASSSSIFQP